MAGSLCGTASSRGGAVAGDGRGAGAVKIAEGRRCMERHVRGNLCRACRSEHHARTSSPSAPYPGPLDAVLHVFAWKLRIRHCQCIRSGNLCRIKTRTERNALVEGEIASSLCGTASSRGGAVAGDGRGAGLCRDSRGGALIRNATSGGTCAERAGERSTRSKTYGNIRRGAGGSPSVRGRRRELLEVLFKVSGCRAKRRD